MSGFKKVSPNIWDLVVQDMRDRSIMGYNKYNKYLTVCTDEPMMQHLYEELLDAAVYIRTKIEQEKQNVSRSTNSLT